jgi:hypothetical protein
MAFPSIANPTQLEEETWKAQLKSDWETGGCQSRAKFTAAKEKWKLSWTKMTAADYAILKAYLAANMGATFSWTHPNTATVYTARFSDDKIKGVYSPKAPGFIQVTIELEEA